VNIGGSTTSATAQMADSAARTLAVTLGSYTNIAATAIGTSTAVYLPALTSSALTIASPTTSTASNRVLAFTLNAPLAPSDEIALKVPYFTFAGVGASPVTSTCGTTTFTVGESGSGAAGATITLTAGSATLNQATPCNITITGVTTSASSQLADWSGRTLAVSLAASTNISEVGITTSTAISTGTPVFVSGPEASTTAQAFITVRLQSSQHGTASCLALPSGTTPSGAGDFSQGFNATVVAPASNVFPNITGLQGNTAYDVFCYLEYDGVAMVWADVLSSKVTLTTLVACPRVATTAFTSGGSSVNAVESTIQAGSLFLSITLSCETWSPNADATSLLGNVTISSSVQAAGFTTRVLAISNPSMLSFRLTSGELCSTDLGQACTTAVLDLPYAPGYEISTPETVSVLVPGHTLVPTGKQTSQADLVAGTATIGLDPGIARLAFESTFPASEAGGAVPLAQGGRTVIFALEEDYFLNPMPAACVLGLQGTLLGSLMEASAWQVKKALITSSDYSLWENTGCSTNCSAGNAAGCVVMKLTVPALSGYAVTGSEVVTFGLPAACVASAVSYLSVASRTVTARQYCPAVTGSECNGHGTCVQDGAYCDCQTGWAGVKCEISCTNAKCASSKCPACSSQYSVGSWYDGY